MEIKQAVERISKLKENEIGSTEENVKQKIIVPLLELLGHKRENLEFEYRTRSGGKMDIFIKNVPSDCKVIIDTKNYNEDLNDHIEQIKEYTFDEAALLAVIANGIEIRIYSPLRGVAFEKSLLYSLNRQDLEQEEKWKTLSELLHYENLANRKVLSKISEREREIRDAMVKEEHFRKELNDKTLVIDSDIDIREDEIKKLRSEKENVQKETQAKISEIWSAIDLPLELFVYPASIPLYSETLIRPSGKEAAYINSYREQLKNPNNLISKIKRYIDEKHSVSFNELKKICVEKFGCKSDTSGSIGASIQVLLIDGYISQEGRADNRRFISKSG